MASVKVFGADGSLSDRYQDICKVTGIEPVGWIGNYLCGSNKWLVNGVPNLKVLNKGNVFSAEAVELFWKNVIDSLCLSKDVVLGQVSGEVHNLEGKLAHSWVGGGSPGVPVFRYSEYDKSLHLHASLRPYAHFLFPSEADSFRWILNLFDGNREGNRNISGDVFTPDREPRQFWIDVLSSVRISPVLIGAAGYADAVRTERSIVEYQSRCEQVFDTFGVPYSWSDIEKLLKK